MPRSLGSMLRRLVVVGVFLAVQMPLLLAAIVVAFLAAMQLPGVELHRPVTLAWIIVFFAVFAAGVYFGSLVAYAIVFVAFRLCRVDHWIEEVEAQPEDDRRWIAAPFRWIRENLRRAISR